jgi:hypothetical protein
MNNKQLESTLPPWTRGPFELIRHADGHMKDAGDTDRRIALIGFDNAIEVCIDVFLNLHPRVRKGYEIKNEEKNRALQNYYSKVEYLDNYVQAQKLDLKIPFEAIVWYHQLRNELYHSGNGMVPEMYVIEGARSAAVAVFKALFDIDISPLLTPQVLSHVQHMTAIPRFKENDQMEFLRAFIDFEKALEAYVSLYGAGSTHVPRTVQQRWRYFAKTNEVPEQTGNKVEEVFKARNSIVHSGEYVESDALIDMFILLDDVTKLVNEAIHRPSSFRQ